LAGVMSLAICPTLSWSEEAEVVEAEAVEAVKAMGKYLRSLKSFELQADVSRDDALDSGDLVQRNERVVGLARIPDRFVVRTTSAGHDREIIYDGSNLTIYGHKIGYYAQFKAPETIRKTVELAAERYDIEIPLSDLFFWGTDEADLDEVTSAFKVGEARIGDRICDQYSFSQEGADWQIWIARGDHRAPCKLLIIDTSQDAHPQYSAVISLNPDRTFADEVFVFSPPATARRIDIAAPEVAN
jgi:hypothetical protein